MNNRIVTWAAVACLSAYASSVGAVALGEMRALSALGEPLKLRLALTDLASVSPADVRVILAPADDYTRLGLIPPLGAEQWQVAMQTDNGLSAVISSDAAPQDPNLSFLVQLVWPGNIRVQQVTAVLLPATVVAAEPIMVVPTLPAVIPGTEEIAAGSASVAVPSTPAESKAAEIEEIATEPVTARVKAGDTLSGLARSWYLPKATLQQRQQVLAESNSHAFIAGNINQLKRGAIIRYPLAHSLTLPDAGQAADWLAARQVAAAQEGTLDAPALSTQAASGNAAADQEVTLTLVSPDSASRTAQATSDEAEAAGEMSRLLAKKNALLADRAALQAELAALEKQGGSQDARLKVLDARLAQLNAPTTATTPASSGNADASSAADASGWRSSWVAAAVGFFLALLLVMRRRAAAASAAAAAARTQPQAAPENDYAAFEPLETLPVPAWSAADSAGAAPYAGMAAADPDEEYDFLSDAESAALQTRLDLAQAYIDMQETELAKELLRAVVARGNATQRSQADALLTSLA